MLTDDRKTTTPAADAEISPPIQPPPERELDTAVLARIEQLLGEIRGTLDAAARGREHRDFSLGLLVGSILQVIVVGLLALALLDWIFGAAFASLLIKLAFAAVLQLSALTAFVVLRINR